MNKTKKLKSVSKKIGILGITLFIFTLIFANIGGVDAYTNCNWTGGSVPSKITITQGGTLGSKNTIYFTAKRVKFSSSNCGLSGNYIAYCFTGVNADAPTTATSPTKISAGAGGPGYTYILKHGYAGGSTKICDKTGKKCKTLSASDAEFATQIAIWRYKVHLGVSSDAKRIFGTDGAYAWASGTSTNALIAANYLYQGALGETSYGTPKAKITSPSIELTKRDNYYYSRATSVTEANSDYALNNYTLSITTKPAISGVEAIGSEETPKTKFDAGRKFKIRVPESSITKALGDGTLKSTDTLEVTVTAKPNSRHYVAYLYDSKSSSYQDVVPTVMMVENVNGTEAKITYELELEDAPFRKVTIEKVDSETDDHVTGAKIEVTLTKGQGNENQGQQYKQEFVVGTTPLTISEVNGQKIQQGDKISAKEICAPSESGGSCFTAQEVEEHNKENDYQGYSTKNETVVDGTVGTKNLTLQIKNTPDKYCLTLNKKDNLQNTLLGAKFTLTGPEGYSNNLSDLTTNGTITLNGLRAGTYTLTETQVPDGYNFMTPNPHVIKLGTNNNSGGCYTETLIDPLKSRNIDVLKIDAFTGNPLAGAEFQVIDKETEEVVDTWVSTTRSHTIVDSRKGNSALGFGTYKIVETRAPSSDYVLAEPYEFTVDETTEEGMLITLKDERVPTVYRFAKRDATTKEYVAGAVLTIYDESGKPVEKVTTEESPVALKEQLKEGKYTVEETFAPNGYVKLEVDPIEFEVKKDAGDYEIVIENYKEPTKHYISKKDITTGEEVKGATLVIKNEQGKEVKKWVSGDEPKLIDDLPVGIYTLEETIAPNGYVLSSDKITFEVKSDGVIRNDNVMYNTPIIQVPNTASSMPMVIYLIGFAILTSGAGTVYYNAKKQR